MKKLRSLVIFFSLFSVFSGFSQPYSITVNNASGENGMNAYAIVSGDVTAKSAYPFTIGPNNDPFTVTLEWAPAKDGKSFLRWIANGAAYPDSQHRITLTADNASPNITVDCIWQADGSITPTPYAEPTSTPYQGYTQYNIKIDSGIPEEYEKTASAKVEITGNYTSTFQLPCEIGPYPDPFAVHVKLYPTACCGIQGGALDDLETSGTEGGLEYDISADAANNERRYTAHFIIWSTAVPATPEPQPTDTPPTPVPNRTLGDVNMDGTIDIIDALLVARNYVSLPPAIIDPTLADVDRNGTADIVDALRIAQCYVGIISCAF